MYNRRAVKLWPWALPWAPRCHHMLIICGCVPHGAGHITHTLTHTHTQSLRPTSTSVSFSMAVWQVWTSPQCSRHIARSNLCHTTDTVSLFPSRLIYAQCSIYVYVAFFSLISFRPYLCTPSESLRINAKKTKQSSSKGKHEGAV